MDFSTDKMWCTLKSNEQTNQWVVRVTKPMGLGVNIRREERNCVGFFH